MTKTLKGNHVKNDASNLQVLAYSLVMKSLYVLICSEFDLLFNLFKTKTQRGQNWPLIPTGTNVTLTPHHIKLVSYITQLKAIKLLWHKKCFSHDKKKCTLIIWEPKVAIIPKGWQNKALYRGRDSERKLL